MITIIAKNNFITNWNGDLVGLQAVIISNNDFTVSDGTQVLTAGLIYKKYPLIATFYTDVYGLDFPQMLLAPTTNSMDNPNATYKLEIWNSSNNVVATIPSLSAFKLDYILNPTTWNDIISFTFNSVPQPLGFEAYSKSQVDQLIANRGFNPISPATPTTFGSVKTTTNNTTVVSTDDTRLNIADMTHFGRVITTTGNSIAVATDDTRFNLLNNATPSTNGTVRTTTNNPTVVSTDDPRLFNFGDVADVINNYGAKNDAQLYTNAVVTPGSLNITIPGRNATDADIGKNIVLYGCGSISGITGLNNVLRTTIAGRSGTQFTLAALPVGAGNGRVVFGTNNTTAFQNAINGLVASGGGTLFIPAGLYMIGSVNVPSNIHIYSAPGTSMLYSISTSVFPFISASTNITIDGISIDACGNPIGNGGVTLVGGTGLSNIRIQRCNFTDTFLTNNLAPVSTFNRHGILVRDQIDCWILFNRFENCLRIKAAGGTVGEKNTYIIGNTLLKVNENGISILSPNAVTVSDFYILDNTIDSIVATGDGIVIGDDGGGGSGQSFININIIGNILKATYGPLPGGTAFIQDKGSGFQKNIKINNNTIDNALGTNQNTVFAINKANQGTISSTINFQASGNVIYGYYNSACCRFGNISNGLISNNQIHSLAAPNAIDKGFKFGTCSNLQILNNYANGCSNNMYFTDITTTIVKNNVCLNALDSNIYLETSGSGTFSSIRFENNNLRTAVNYGFDFGIVGTHTDSFINNDLTGSGVRDFHNQPAGALVVYPPEITAPPTLTNNNATPAVLGRRNYKAANSGATVITNFIQGYINQVISIRFTNGNTTIQENANIKLSGGVNFVGTADDILTLILWDDNVWRESNRSINA